MNTFVFFRYGANFDRVARKSKTYGTIGNEMPVSFCKDETHCARCFNIAGRFGKNKPQRIH
ncbi:hypothetical protein BSR03_07280 [Serratia proteamaculans]|nr:hypothetical protein E4343_18965 [Serratia quinivorans]RYM63081.1 hypothetical protein BSR03_07280 [Serratia proteamaculans]TFZ48981.1 hypothetical protein E5C26_21895 [Serratia proteamaculans]